MEPEQHLDVVMDTEALQSGMTQARVSVVQYISEDYHEI